MKKEELERLSADAELWEAGKLGRSPKHMKSASAEEEKAIDDALGLQLISIRLNRSLIERLKQHAALEGIGYQPLIRQILTRYAKDNEHKLDIRLSANEAADRADTLFTEALKLQNNISKLPLLSNERILAESNYTKNLGLAQALFNQTLAGSLDSVLKRHAKLRLKQIEDICQGISGKGTQKKQNKKKRAV